MPLEAVPYLIQRHGCEAFPSARRDINRHNLIGRARSRGADKQPATTVGR